MTGGGSAGPIDGYPGALHQILLCLKYIGNITEEISRHVNFHEVDESLVSPYEMTDNEAKAYLICGINFSTPLFGMQKTINQYN